MRCRRTNNDVRQRHNATFVSPSKYTTEMSSHLGPVCHVPARLAWVLLAFLLGFWFFIQLTVVISNDGHEGAEFLHADDVSTQNAVAACHGTLPYNNIDTRVTVTYK